MPTSHQQKPVTSNKTITRHASALNVLIVGAGIAGLCMARLLKEQGHQVVVYEKHVEQRSEGAGICLPANAMLGLQKLGLAAKVRQYSHQVHSIQYSKANGELLAKASLDVAPLNSADFVALSRPQLLSLLADGLSANIRYGHYLTELNQIDDAVEVINNQGETHRFDLLIGADGIHSATRQRLHPGAEASTLPVTHWRFIANMDTKGLEPNYYVGNDSAFMIYPMSPNQVYCYAQVVDRYEAWLSSTPSIALLEIFSRYNDKVRACIAQADDEQIIADKLRTVDKAFYYQGRVVLVGDALHGCPPSLQQGVGLSLEDVLTLANLLENHPVEEAIRNYQTKRQSRIEWVINESNHIIDLAAKGKYLPGRLIRNFLIRKNGPANVAGWRKLLTELPDCLR